jgi:hypothetical protein
MDLARELADANRLNGELRAEIAELQVQVKALQKRLEDAEREQRFRRLAKELKGSLSPEEWEAMKKQID